MRRLEYGSYPNKRRTIHARGCTANAMCILDTDRVHTLEDVHELSLDSTSSIIVPSVYRLKYRTDEHTETGIHEHNMYQQLLARCCCCLIKRVFSSLQQSTRLRLPSLFSLEAWAPVLLFSELNNFFLGHFYPINVSFHNENKHFSGWPDRCFGWNDNVAEHTHSTIDGEISMKFQTACCSAHRCFWSVAETPVRSPWKTWIFIVKNTIYWIKVSKKKHCNLILKTNHHYSRGDVSDISAKTK